MGPTRLRATRRTATASRTRAPRPPICSRSSTTSASNARTSSASRSAGGRRSGLAIDHADRVRSLVLADTIGGIAIEEWWKAAVQAQRDGPFNHPALSNDFCLRQSRARAPLPADRRPEARAGRTTSSRCCGAWARSPSTTRRSPRHRVPTMFIVGTRGRNLPARDDRRSGRTRARCTGRARRRSGPLAVFRAARGLERPGARLLGGQRLTLRAPPRSARSPPRFGTSAPVPVRERVSHPGRILRGSSGVTPRTVRTTVGLADASAGHKGGPHDLRRGVDCSHSERRVGRGLFRIARRMTALDRPLRPPASDGDRTAPSCARTTAGYATSPRRSPRPSDPRTRSSSRWPT